MKIIARYYKILYCSKQGTAEIRLCKKQTCLIKEFASPFIMLVGF